MTVIEKMWISANTADEMRMMIALCYSMWNIFGESKAKDILEMSYADFRKKVEQTKDSKSEGDLILMLIDQYIGGEEEFSKYHRAIDAMQASAEDVAWMQRQQAEQMRNCCCTLPKRICPTCGREAPWPWN